jgi:hypothetical protein
VSRSVPTLAAIAAVLVLLVTLLEVFEVMLLPRRVRRRRRLVRLFFGATWLAWRGMARPLSADRRAGLLGAYGPLAMIVLLATWTLALVVAFGVLQWALARGGAAPSLLNQLYFSGVTFFTLGFGDVTAPTRAGKVLSVIEAGTGFGFIAVTIGYLPVLYQLFAQRETFVIRLDARAGSPPSAASLLERHSGDEGLASLTTLLAQWEEWSASILESHLTYPMLAYYRSQHDNESWLAALTAVADACALLIVGVAPRGSGEIGVAAFQARMTFAGARLVLVEMGRTLAAGELREAVRTAARESGDVVAGAVREVVHDAGADAAVLASGDAEGDEPLAPPPARDGARRARPAADRHEFPDRLDAATFARLAECLGSSGYALPPDAPRALAELRATYEPYAVALGRYLALTLPRWMPDARATDNWERGAGGGAARRAFEAAEERG